MAVKREACDIWFSKCVRHRDQHRCQYCFKEGPIVLMCMAEPGNRLDGLWIMLLPYADTIINGSLLTR